ncbi:hypothetical protein BRARA_D00375 [Brassica rapa]|uniref:LIM zinc-binding domain-containing protein n=1 Tax=Brassica campestris TaxID=3711 RepID=A0A397ZJH3_BRACM|nr:hypothetical protein BRARA_D00375 [Brassica rapa]
MSSFTGTQQKCKACEKTVYPVELLSADGVSYHKSCFKCTHCKSRLQHHFAQLFKEKGSYNHLIKSASIKRSAAAAVAAGTPATAVPES